MCVLVWTKKEGVEGEGEGKAQSLIFHVEWSSMKKDYLYYNFSIVT